jgi:hypothetical protein
MTSFATGWFHLLNEFSANTTTGRGDIQNLHPVHFYVLLFLKDGMNLRLPLDPLGEKLLDEFREVLPGTSIF